MHSIFSRLFISFSLTILIAALTSGLIMFSFTSRSLDSFRRDFLQHLQGNITRSVVFMGQAAYLMRQHRGATAFADYVQEIQSSMRTRLYLCIDNKIYPEKPALDPAIAQLIVSASTSDEPIKPILQDEGRELVVVQRLSTPEGLTYLVIALHRLGPPPGMGGPPPPHEGPGHGFPPPLPHQDGFMTFLGRIEGLRYLFFLPFAGVICYLLARSFSAPLARLRRISRQIAAGDLSARVGTSLGKPGNEIGDLARDFDHMAERMQGLVNSQKRLLLDISHELRSPLTRLNLALELAKKHSPEEDGNLARIGRESERLNVLIGQLLTLTRNESLVIDADAPPVLLADLLLEIGEDVDFETRNSDRGVKILTLEPLVMGGSRELLRQAIENIMRNGASYTRPGSRVEVSLFSRPVDGGQRWAVIRVRDYGPGVPEDKLPHLTKPFFRVAEARDRNSGGVGLGLAIAHQAIHQHGGSLKLANAPDQDGLVVDIELPIREEVAANGRKTTDNPANGSSRTTTFS